MTIGLLYCEIGPVIWSITHRRCAFDPIEYAKQEVLWEEFAGVAREYCALLEAKSLEKKSGRLRELYRLLSHLQWLMTRLWGVPPAAQEEVAEAQFALENSEIIQLVSRVGERLKAFHASIPESDVSTYKQESLISYLKASREVDITRSVMLFDDIGGVYDEVKGGLMVWDRQTDNAREDAKWQWHYSWEGHWGYHAIQACQSIHEALFHNLWDDAAV